jgi:hypothetical protein
VIASSSEEHGWKALSVVLEGFIRRAEWAEALSLAVKYFPNMPHSKDAQLTALITLARGFAYSTLGPESLSGGHNERIAHMLREIQESPAWKNEISPRVLGAALERVGNLVDALKYYETVEADADPALQKFAVYRWLVTKKKQEQLYRQRQQENSAQRAARDYSNKVHDWEHRRSDIKRVEIEKEPPYPTLDPESSVRTLVFGLGPEVKVDDLGSGIRFKISGIEITTNWNTHRLLLTRDDLTSVSVNLQTQKASSEEIEVSASTVSGVFQFEISALSCTGIAINTGDALRVNLVFKFISDHIVLDFPPFSKAHLPDS